MSHVTLQAKIPTLLKSQPLADSTKLEVGKEKVLIGPDINLKLHSYVDQSKHTGHIKIALLDEFFGTPPRNTWYVYAPHITINKPSYQAPSDTSAAKPKSGTLITIPGISHQVSLTDPVSSATPNFTWNEVTKGGTRIPLNAPITYNIVAMALELQKLRDNVFDGRTITVTSWYRPPRINKSVGGVSNSRHLSGDGIDIKVKGLTAKQAQRILDSIWKHGLGYGKTFTHLDLRNYRARWKYN